MLLGQGLQINRIIFLDEIPQYLFFPTQVIYILYKKLKKVYFMIDFLDIYWYLRYKVLCIGVNPIA